MRGRVSIREPGVSDADLGIGATRHRRECGALECGANDVVDFSMV
jgi:hypothetical protein